MIKFRGKHICELCDMTFNSKKEFDAHQISLLHQGTIDAVEEMKKKFRSPQDFDKIPTLKDRTFSCLYLHRIFCSICSFRNTIKHSHSTTIG